MHPCEKLLCHYHVQWSKRMDKRQKGRRLWAEVDHVVPVE
jgi:hypothetical protein